MAQRSEDSSPFSPLPDLLFGTACFSSVVPPAEPTGPAAPAPPPVAGVFVTFVSLDSAPVAGSLVVVVSVTLDDPSGKFCVEVCLVTTGFSAEGVPAGTHLTLPLDEVKTPSVARHGGVFWGITGGFVGCGKLDWEQVAPVFLPT